jgi:hypothetical protein
MQAASEEKEAKLRMAHDYNNADLEEFDRNLQTKIDNTKDAQEN